MNRARLEEMDSWVVEDGAGWTLHRDTQVVHQATFASSVLVGLQSEPRQLDCRWLYDATGSELYEQITRTDDYYPTRTEDRILSLHAADIRERVGPSTVVELGSGSSTKTRHLLDAWAARGSVRYAPIDVSPTALRGACEELAERYPGARIDGYATSYERGLEALTSLTPKTVVFLGSTLGNYDREGTRAFLTMVRDSLAPGDGFLLGLDRVKPARVLEAAYDDAEGWTRKFILNLFARMNRELAADVPLDALRYEARWNAEHEQVEMWVHTERDVEVRVNGTAAVPVSAGESILVEISRKFRPDEIRQLGAELGLVLDGTWSDPQDWFSVLLFRR